MRRRNRAALLLAALSLFGLAPARAKRASAQPSGPVPEAPAAGTERRLVEYAGLYLPWDPDGKITVEKATLKLPGFSSWRVERTGRHEASTARSTISSCGSPDSILMVEKERHPIGPGAHRNSSLPRRLPSSSTIA